MNDSEKLKVAIGLLKQYVEGIEACISLSKKHKKIFTTRTAKDTYESMAKSDIFINAKKFIYGVNDN